MTEAIRLLTPNLGLSVGVALIVALSACGGGGSSHDDLIEVGRTIYDRDCLICHGEARTGKGGLANAPAHGPDGHTWHHPDGQLRELILGTLDYPQKTMPSFVGRLTDSEVEAVLEYIKSNWDTPQIEYQAEVSLKELELNRGKESQ